MLMPCAIEYVLQVVNVLEFGEVYKVVKINLTLPNIFLCILQSEDAFVGSKKLDVPRYAVRFYIHLQAFTRFFACSNIDR